MRSAPVRNPSHPSLSRIASLEEEAKRVGASPMGARIHHEIGKLWEQDLGNEREAALAYRRSLRMDPTYVPNLRALRRLLSREGGWHLALPLLEAELAADAPPGERAALRLEQVRLLLRLGRREDARAAVEAAVRTDPGAPGALAMLETLCGDAPVFAQAVRSIAAPLDAGERARLLAAGALTLERRRHATAALALYREAHRADPADDVALEGLIALLDQTGRLDELAQVLEAREARRPSNCLSLRVAQVRIRLDEEERALAALERAPDPDDPLVLAELARLLERRRSWDRLAKVRRRQAAVATDPAERISLYFELARMHEEHLDDPETAIDFTCEILRIDEANGPALAALGKLQHQLGDWEGLLATTELEARLAPTHDERVAHAFKAAQILEERLGQPRAALRRSASIFLEAPTYLPALRALWRIAESTGDWADLLGILQGALPRLEGPEETQATLLQIAEIQGEKLGRPADATETYLRLLALYPDNLTAIRALSRTAERCEDWGTLAAALLLEAKRTRDPHLRVELLHRRCEVLEDRLGDVERAIEGYEQIVSFQPAYTPALRALGRLYAQRGRWESLVRMHRQQAQVTQSREMAAALLYKVGELLEHKLCDEEQAVEAYRQVLAYVPDHFSALGRLASIHRSQNAWGDLVEVLEREADLRSEPAGKARVLYEAAQILEESMGALERAVEGFCAVLHHQPAHEAALFALDRVLGKLERHREREPVLERLARVGSGPCRAHRLVRLAHLRLVRLGDPRGARVACEEALEAHPEHRAARDLLAQARHAADHEGGGAALPSAPGATPPAARPREAARPTAPAEPPPPAPSAGLPVSA